MSENLLIHVGYQKTGTTWLQKFVFGELEESFLVLGKPKGGFRKNFYYNNQTLSDPFDFDAKSLRSAVLSRIQQDDRMAVLSDEAFAGNIFRGGIDRREIADRLAAVFPNAKILITVREQVSMIQSAYAHFLRIGGLCSLESFMSTYDEYHIAMFNLTHLDYHKLVEYYRYLYGAENTLVLPLELLAIDPHDYLGRLSSFVGIQLNVSDEAIQRRTNVSNRTAFAAYYYLRWANLLGRRNNNNARFSLERGLPVAKLMRIASQFVPDRFAERHHDRIIRKIRSHIGDRFKEGNRILESYAGIDLHPFGY